MTRRRNTACDAGHEGRGAKIRRLNLGGGAGAYLCAAHWRKEMAWRKQRNRTLTGSARFSIRRFPK